eukprot:6840148-Pyramimonas_sp.AAC.1
MVEEELLGQGKLVRELAVCGVRKAHIDNSWRLQCNPMASLRLSIAVREHDSAHDQTVCAVVEWRSLCGAGSATTLSISVLRASARQAFHRDCSDVVITDDRAHIVSNSLLCGFSVEGCER